MRISRKQFLMTGLAAIGTVDVAATAGCGSEDSAAPPAGDGCKTGNAQVDIDGNHGHQLIVSPADVAAGVAKTYDITGSATHSHEVILSPAHFTRLKAGGRVSVESTPLDHTHPVSIICA